MDKDLLIDNAKHCIGLDYKKSYTRHGKKFYRPYRNYYAVHISNGAWMHLKEKGYADHDQASECEHCIFWLTRKGLDWLGKELDITIYNESD